MTIMAPEADDTTEKKTTRNPFARVALFIRQVIAELRKVVWPSRKQLISYTLIVIGFVLIVGMVVTFLDYLFTEGVLQIFG